MSALTTVPVITGDIILHGQHNPDLELLPYFDFRAAEREVYAYCKAEKHSAATVRKYRAALGDFIGYLTAHQRLPTREVVYQYLSGLDHLNSRTVASYLPPVRRFMTNLAEQELQIRHLEDGRLMFDLIGKQRAIAAATKIKNPSRDETNYEAPIFHTDHRKVANSAKWLTYEEAIDLVSSIDQDDLRGLRDYTVLVVGFNTALRCAEIARISLNSFQRRDVDTFTVTVRGKRNNMTPVPAPKAVYDQVRAYVEAYNSRLPDGDPRRIQPDQPIWRPLTKAQSNIYTDVAVATRSLSDRSIRRIVTDRSAEWNPHNRISPHDMRRTAALIALQRGMDIHDIQVMLRHASIATTEHYLGDGWRDYSKSSLSTYDAVIVSPSIQFEGL